MIITYAEDRLLQVAHAAMNQLRGARRRAAGKVVRLDQGGLQTCMVSVKECYQITTKLADIFANGSTNIGISWHRHTSCLWLAT